MDVFAKHCVFALTFLATVAFTACDDQNFDWEKAKSENVEYQYNQNFKQIFGSIDPDQGWDFSGSTVILPSTRATVTNYTPYMPKTTAGDYYYVQDATISWLQNTLKEGNNNTSLGSAFTMILPEKGFKITPIYQGNASLTWELHMVIQDGENTYDQKIWTKGQGIQSGSKCTTCNGHGGTACTHCNANGYTIETCPTCLGTGVVTDGTISAPWYNDVKKVYKISNQGNSNTYNLNGTTVSNSANLNYAVISDGNKTYLCYYENNSIKYMKITKDGSNYTIGSVSSCLEASPLVSTPAANNSKIQFDVNGTTVSLARSSSTLSATDGNSNVKNWTWTEVTNNNFKNAINSLTITGTKLCTQCNGNKTINVKCAYCSGEGHIDVCSSCNGSGANINGTWNNVNSGNTLSAAAVRALSLVWGDANSSPLPAYKEVYFYLELTNGNTYGTKGTKQSSLNAMMLTLTCPTPTNVDTNHETIIIGCEDCNNSNSDWDYNDIVFLIEGFPTVPKPVIINGNTYYTDEVESKRYMVEDMGYSDANSSAVTLGYTDIDFNDIVIDFTKTQRKKHVIEYENGVKTKDETTNDGDPTYEAKVRALGGTWDFILYVGNTPVFQKSKSTASSTDAPTVSFNAEYLVGGNAVERLYSNIIYNTSAKTATHFDGNFNQNTWICTLNDDAIKQWNPTTHNISFKIVGDTQYGEGFNSLYDSKTDGSNVYSITWPAKGETPKIAAFKTTKQWQQEKNPVSKDFFSTSATWGATSN